MNRTTEMGKSIAITVPSQVSPEIKGKFLEQLAGQILKRQSYEIIDTIRFTGMEIDLLCRHKPSSQQLYVECKFHTNTLGANAIDQCIGQAFRKRIPNIAIFSAGPLGKEAKGAVEELRQDSGINFSYYGTDEILDALTDSAIIRIPDPDKLPSSITHATLLVHPDLPYIWLLQEQRDARPYRLIPYTESSVRDCPPPKKLRSILDAAQLLEGLEIAEYLEKDAVISYQPTVTKEPSQEHVSLIATADSLVDYRPCRPADFVGRTYFQKELWDYFNSVRTENSKTRVIALTGASGFGKSSLVAKLSDRFSNQKWRNRLFLHAVDVRSARGTMFVAEALLQGVNAAQQAGFIDSNIRPEITDADSVLSSIPISSVFADLRKNNRIFILFFDQFEEIFTKDELLPLFRVFKRMVLDLSALQPNLVVGFSWRTGISLSDENPAYQMWHEIADHRLTKMIPPFDSGESSRMISQFERLLDQKLAPPLRRRLIEQSQGMPWLLKKLCIHVYRQIRSGKSQIELLGSRLNVKSLFDEDLNPLTETQLACLRYIALNSPADSMEVYNRFSDDVVTSLVNQRIIVRTGQRFTVYWDIFRDYIAEDSVPTIPWTYIPNYRPGMSISALKVLQQQGAVSIASLSKQLQYTERTTFNIITDLLNMMICEKDDKGHYVPAKGVSLSTVAERVRSQFSEHIIYRNLIANSDAAIHVSRDRAIDVVRHLYSSGEVKPKTRDNYFKKLIPWLRYAGFVDTVGSEVQFYPPMQKSDNYGRLSDGEASQRSSLFVGAAPPESSKELLKKVLLGHVITSEYVILNKYRNAAQDLVVLGLCHWERGTLSCTEQDWTDIDQVFKTAIEKSSTMVILGAMIEKIGTMTRRELGNLIGEHFKKQWKDSSAKRYANGLYRYWGFIQGCQKTIDLFSPNPDNPEQKI